jgi:hypothetical protein
MQLYQPLVTYGSMLLRKYPRCTSYHSTLPTYIMLFLALGVQVQSTQKISFPSKAFKEKAPVSKFSKWLNVTLSDCSAHIPFILWYLVHSYCGSRRACKMAVLQSRYKASGPLRSQVDLCTDNYFCRSRYRQSSILSFQVGQELLYSATYLYHMSHEVPAPLILLSAAIPRYLHLCTILTCTPIPKIRHQVTVQSRSPYF